MLYRAATAGDAEAIAALHADSWRRFYRGAYADSYLDGDVLGDRRRVWRERLTAGAGDTRTIVADSDGQLAGFAHVVLDDDATWGALLDNLHVVHDRHRQGIGRELMLRVAAAVAHARPGSGFYLWVLEQNRRAQAFYESVGGRRCERALVDAPGGDPSRLDGSPAKLRYTWSEPALLLRTSAAGR